MFGLHCIEWTVWITGYGKQKTSPIDGQWFPLSSASCTVRLQRAPCNTTASVTAGRLPPFLLPVSLSTSQEPLQKHQIGTPHGRPTRRLARLWNLGLEYHSVSHLGAGWPGCDRTGLLTSNILSVMSSRSRRPSRKGNVFLMALEISTLCLLKCVNTAS